MNLCIVQPNVGITSETFIRAHAERLPAKTTVIHSFPVCANSRPVLGTSLLARGYRKLARFLGSRDYQNEVTLSYLTAFRRFSPDLVLAEYGTTGVAVMEACQELGIPLVVHFHGYDASMHVVLQENAATYPRLFRLATALVVVSQPMRDQVLSLGAPPEKIHYNPDGIDCQLFQGATPGTAAPDLLAVGRFVEKKAPHLTIAAFAEARSACPAARLRMIGDGPLLEQCRELVTRLGLGDAVEFLGPQPHDVVRQELQRARAFVQHSVQAPSGDSEGLPVGILEAAASGLPVVATRHAGIPEAVVDGETGFLVEERDVAGMAAALRRVLVEADLAARLGQKARERIRASFSMERSIDGLSAILRSCLSVDAPPSHPFTGFEACPRAASTTPGDAQVRSRP
jgi:colanic acid/amylovoran biosynthesis glycosyltransferase